MKKPNYARSRLMYIIEAALEYFISILIGGAYIAKVATAIGFSDGTVGIITSFLSLGQAFQLLALLLRDKTPVKKWVTGLHVLNQCLFSLVWFTPLFPFSTAVKGALFIVFLLSGHILGNVLMPSKTNWFMSLVDDHKRGVFTANKEIVSLISGMIFSYVMGALYDYFEASGNVTAAFLVGGATIAGLMILHTLTLLLSDEKPVESKHHVSIRAMFADRKYTGTFFLVIGMNALWSVSHYISTPFYGTYQIKELGFSMTFVSVLGIVYAVVRSVFSRVLGRYADKKSFASMLNVCYILVGAAFLINSFAAPGFGRIFFIVYYVLYAISMAGLNSAMINLIYDYVNPEHRTLALAFSSGICGVLGFLSTFLAGFLVDWIQSLENGFLGLGIYAQQVVSFLSFLLVIGCFLYVNLVVRKLPKRGE